MPRENETNPILSVLIGYTHPGLRQFYEEKKQVQEQSSALSQEILADLQPYLPYRRDTQILNLNSVVVLMEEMFQPLMTEDLELTTALAPDLGQVEADPHQIEQMIFLCFRYINNIVSHGGQLTIETDNITVGHPQPSQDNGHVSPGSYVLLTMRASGPDVTIKLQTELLEISRVIYDLVRQHEGYLDVMVKMGRSIALKIYLPCFQESHPSKGAAKPHVLLVKNEDIYQELLGGILAGHGYQVLETESGEEALRICEQHQDDVHLFLLTNVVMPGGMSGRDFARQLISKRPDTRTFHGVGERLYAHTCDRDDYRILIGVPPNNPVRWAEVSQTTDKFISAEGYGDIDYSDITAFFVTYPNGQMVDSHCFNLPIPAGVARFVPLPDPDMDIIQLQDLETGKHFIEVTYGQSTAQPTSPHHYSTTLTNISDQRIRILRFAGYCETPRGWEMNTVTGKFFSAEEFVQWYGLGTNEWIEPGSSVIDPNNYGGPPALWAYYGETESGVRFLAGAVF